MDTSKIYDKVIFLDIDGVLNSETTTEKIPDIDEEKAGIDEKNLKILVHLVKQTGARIVLSSSWRTSFVSDGNPLPDAKYLEERLAQHGLKISSFTRVFPHALERGYEIFDWLSRHIVSAWVVIDNEYFFDFLKYGIEPHFVHTSRYHGLTEEDAQKVMEILNGKLNTETEKELAKRRYDEEWRDVIDSEFLSLSDIN